MHYICCLSVCQILELIIFMHFAQRALLFISRQTSRYWVKIRLLVKTTKFSTPIFCAICRNTKTASDRRYILIKIFYLVKYYYKTVKSGETTKKNEVFFNPRGGRIYLHLPENRKERQKYKNPRRQNYESGNG